ncbi:MAG: UvrD-helicase domain-containing protein, partial [Proteobacteria bacterium]|nr:UvrD-helicase domain-containing protein [Pseudomonadota bacterium]
MRERDDMRIAPPQALDWMRLPLAAPRRVLIEASAGTGKTHTLTLLYLRLLLEAPDDAAADVRGILLSTFTEAAVAELRQRLRARLDEAERLLAVRSGDAAPAVDEAADSLACYLHAHLPLPPAVALLRVRRARQDLDLAPILTLHGFCARVLAELAFDGQGDLSPGEHVDEHDLLDECLRDFWRQRYQRSAVDADELALIVPGGPDALRGELREYFALSAPRIHGGGRAALDALLAALQTPQRIAELGALALDDTRYAPRKRALRERLRKLHALLVAGPCTHAQLAQLLADIDADMLRAQQHPEGTPSLLESTLLQDWLRAAELLREWPAIVRGEVLAAAIDFCRTAMAQRLQQRGGFTFGALIERVRERVLDDAHFAQRLFERYPIALIDEFQDTDPRQYAIFDALYRARGTLLLVGDPKQAIYAFRGGDIATYRRAERSVDARVSLAVNWRSTRSYLDALNGLYAHDADDAMGAGIAYRAVHAGGKADAEALMRAGACVRAPLILR